MLNTMFIDYIEERYKPGEPIFLQDLEESGLKYDNICQQAKQLVDGGKLSRYMDGVYYLHGKGEYGIPLGPSADSVAEAKYISRNGSGFGCYCGHTLANMLGLSKHVPVIKEILTNRTSMSSRTVTVNKARFIIRKAPVFISNENVVAVMLLEVLKDIDELADDSAEARLCLREFVMKNNIEKKCVDSVIHGYPVRTYKALYEMEITNVLF